MTIVSSLRRKWCWLRAQTTFQRAPLVTGFRFIGWAIRCALRIGGKVKLGRWNLRMFLPPRWKGVEKLIFVFREDYEAELVFLERALSTGKTFVDVGANLGIYALVASRIVGPSGRVIAFEPSQQSFLLLKENVVLNKFANVEIYSAAISDRTGKAFLYHGPEPSQNSLGKDPSLKSEGEEVVTQSLDNALSQVSVECVDLIKMDVEGAEELVVRGATKVVSSYKPTIIFEVNQEAAARLGLSSSGAWDLLKGLGYKFFRVRDDGVHEANSLPIFGNIVAIYGSPER